MAALIFISTLDGNFNNATYVFVHLKSTTKKKACKFKTDNVFEDKCPPGCRIDLQTCIEGIINFK